MSRSKRARQCGYCGATRATEADHIPPKNLFAPPRPSNMITVPTCSSCHRPTSKDDEYFRTVLALRGDVAHHPDIRGGVNAAAHRSLARPRSWMDAQQFLRWVREVEVRTATGIILGRAPAYKVEAQRVNRVVQRIAKGLFFHHMRTPFGKGGFALVYDGYPETWAEFSTESRNLIRNVATVLSYRKPTGIGRVFEYRHRHLFDDPLVDVRNWACSLTFY